MMVGPGVLQLVGEEFNWRGSAASEDKKTSGSGTESADHPKCALHLWLSLLF
jgi:hypothetical protein